MVTMISASVFPLALTENSSDFMSFVLCIDVKKKSPVYETFINPLSFTIIVALIECIYFSVVIYQLLQTTEHLLLQHWQ